MDMDGRCNIGLGEGRQMGCPEENSTEAEQEGEKVEEKEKKALQKGLPGRVEQGTAREQTKERGQRHQQGRAKSLLVPKPRKGGSRGCTPTGGPELSDDVQLLSSCCVPIVISLCR